MISTAIMVSLPVVFVESMSSIISYLSFLLLCFTDVVMLFAQNNMAVSCWREGLLALPGRLGFQWGSCCSSFQFSVLWFLVGFVLLIFLVFCVVFFVLFVFFLCLVQPMLPVCLDCPFFIAPSVFSNVYFALYWEVTLSLLKLGSSPRLWQVLNI